jgi:hypothetical protein
MTENVNPEGGFRDDRSRGPHRLAAHNVVATFAGPAEARAALVLLERKGFDADDIELFGPGMAVSDRPIHDDEQRMADVDMTVALERRGVIGAALGAAGGALVGGVIALIASGGAGPVAAAALAGALLAGALGFLWAGFSAMAVNEQWSDTFSRGIGETSLAVHSDNAAKVAAALEALRAAHVDRLATCGPDGELRDVA